MFELLTGCPNFWNRTVHPISYAVLIPDVGEGEGVGEDVEDVAEELPLPGLRRDQPTVNTKTQNIRLKAAS